LPNRPPSAAGTPPPNRSLPLPPAPPWVAVLEKQLREVYHPPWAAKDEAEVGI
jgi:hypothetical protein